MVYLICTIIYSANIFLGGICMGLLTTEVKIKWGRRNKSYFTRLGYEFTKLGDEFTVKVEDLTPRSPIEVLVECDDCEKKFNKNYYSYKLSFEKHSRCLCIDCARKTMKIAQRKYDFHFIKQEFNNRGYTLLTTKEEYEATSTDRIKLKYICNSHSDKGELKITWKNFYYHNKGCKHCKSIILANLHRFDDIKKIERDYELCGFILIDKNYINDLTALKCKCIDCDNISYKKYSHIKTHLKTGNNAGCIFCFKENNKGENHASWKGGISKIQEHMRSIIKQWKIDSFKSTEYKCIITGNYAEVVHHLYGFDSIVNETMSILDLEIKNEVSEYTRDELNSIEEKCIELHYKYGLGAPLTSEVHKLFHSQYGYGQNTPYQFEEFKNNMTVTV